MEALDLKGPWFQLTLTRVLRAGDRSTSKGPGNLVDDGQAMDITGQALGAGGTDDGVGDGSQCYISDPNDGDGLRSYTCNPNDGVRPRRYTSGHDSGSRPSGKVSSGDGRRDVRQPPRAVRRRQAVARSTTSGDEPLRAGVQDESDGVAIAGDPMSSTRLRDRPHRATRLPERFRDFRL